MYISKKKPPLSVLDQQQVRPEGAQALFDEHNRGLTAFLRLLGDDHFRRCCLRLHHPRLRV